PCQHRQLSSNLAWLSWAHQEVIMSRVLALFVIASLGAGCALTGHAHYTAQLGKSRRSADLLAVIDQPGPVPVATINSADWAVDRSGLIDLHDPRAKQLGDGPEPIQVYFHVIRHPTRGTFIVDTGVERA